MTFSVLRAYCPQACTTIALSQSIARSLFSIASWYGSVMDFKLPESLHGPVARAVFGGPSPDAQLLHKAMRANKLDWPVLIVATHEWRPVGKSAMTGVKLLQLHPGLTYLLTNRTGPSLRRSLASLKLKHGSIEPAASPAQLFHAIQQAILSLRSQELQLLEQQDQAQAAIRTDSRPGARPNTRPSTRRARPGRPSWQAELDLQRLLIDQMLRHDPNWSAAAKVWVRLLLLRHPTHLNEVRRKVAQLVGSLCSPIDQSPTLSYAFASAMEQLYRTHAYSDLPDQVLAMLNDLELHLCGQRVEQAHQSTVVTQAMAYIREHFATPISLRDVALHVGVSSPHLARQFKAGTGQNVSQWLWRLRVIRARELLTDTDKTVLDVALDCGFGAVEHFHRVFKTLAGQTPHRYRQMHQR